VAASPEDTPLDAHFHRRRRPWQVDSLILRIPIRLILYCSSNGIPTADQEDKVAAAFAKPNRRTRSRRCRGGLQYAKELTSNGLGGQAYSTVAKEGLSAVRVIRLKGGATKGTKSLPGG